MYRIKTEAEFVEDYGPQWYNKITYGWCSAGRMTYLFGKQISTEQYEECLKTNRLVIDNWSISSKMITNKYFFLNSFYKLRGLYIPKA